MPGDSPTHYSRGEAALGRDFTVALVLLCLVWAQVLCAAGWASAATLIFSPMDSLEGWTVRTLGPAGVQVVPGQIEAAFHRVAFARRHRIVEPRTAAGGRGRLPAGAVLRAENDNVVCGLEVAGDGETAPGVGDSPGREHSRGRFSGTNPWRGGGTGGRRARRRAGEQCSTSAWRPAPGRVSAIFPASHCATTAGHGRR